MSTAHVGESLVADSGAISRSIDDRLALRTKDGIRGVGRLMAFFVLSGATLFATDRFVETGLRRIETAHFGVFNRLVAGDINADILITGSSRALTHYDPRLIQQATGRTAFNIGINGSQTDMQIAVFKAYLNHNVKPALLVHNLDSFTFETTHGGVYLPGQYLPYLNEAPIYDTLATIDRNVWKSKYLPLYGYVVEDMSFIWLRGVGRLAGVNPREDRYLGFQPRHTSWTDDFESFQRANPEGVKFPIEPDGVTQFEGLLALCRQVGIPVLLVYSPVYYEMQALERNRIEVFDRFHALARQYGAVLWDYSRSPVSFRKEYFYNSQHLNADGAARFSAEFAAALARSSVIENHAGSSF